MIKKRANEIFAAVDPHLKVISGGTGRSRHRNRHLSDRDWEKAGGTYCPQCKAEIVQLVGGLCPQCHGEVEARRMEVFERKSQKRYYVEQLRTGRMTLTQMKNLR